ncbi:hypothetical protein CDD81_2158 [Ophiocordyceps australis]|uniref:HpcH/HpaI aldolase/citrate lyase domain-containing protein n=1 Tax=Ophiocordyceps australis TaxID=1399860 RepID=A0A2C5XYN2_9HYPO|nr:hypothetical protein CDD81_2158 [Ophiocordyceps australis]
MTMATPAQSGSILRRCLLYVPASSQRMLTKSVALTADNITYDLEDSVTPALKHDARHQLKSHLASLQSRPKSISELAVRINAVSTPYALDDLTALASSPLVDAIVVPKVDSAADVHFVSDVLRHVSPGRSISILALIESARAITNLSEICSASSLLSGLIFAAEDFAHDLSITRTPSLTEFLFARSAMVTAARAARLPSAIDLVCTSYKGDQGQATLRDECTQGSSMGFNGKQCIHPSQVETVQSMFAPPLNLVQWAVRIVIADEKAAASGRGAWTLDGAMVDAPVVAKAHALVAKAKQCGFNVADLRDKYRDQEPE